ncbi:unnamed protein product [Lymnaea stagnalis]|uniref:Phosphatidylinositol-glycan biosynthesis class W protein n=1 Tax=Lymnaea stagnalis TaxID=6523 RepID=A0AAV2HAR7_LYMST
MSSYKLEHEKFITGHNGTNYLEVTMATSISCFACFARDLFLLSSVGKLLRPRILSEFLLLILPNIISVTIFCDFIELFAFLILFICTVYCMYLKQTHKVVPSTLYVTNLDNRKAFITYFRSIINVCTAVAILAVDFPVFPRKLAKTETYGFGGMDIGVGLFVVANAIVSPETKNRDVKIPAYSHLKKAVFSCIPLLILGVARLLAVKGTDYHEHVTEYGVHWNFFFTLVALKLSLSILYCIIPVNKSGSVATFILILHQSLLSSGLSSYILNGSDGKGGRNGLLDANREGIFSLPGYISIYMFGVQLGAFLFQERKNLKEWWTAAKKLSYKFILFTLGMSIGHLKIEPVSRRLANASFVLWVMSLSYFMILECLVGEIIITCIKAQIKINMTSKIKDTMKKEAQHSLVQTTAKLQRNVQWKDDSNKLHSEVCTNKPDFDVCTMNAVSFNSLLFFLLANVMTGLVNMNISTLQTSDFSAVAILVVYMFLLCLVAVSLKAKNISTKIW